MDVEAIESPGQLEQLRPDWEALWTRCLSATPFQHPGWLLPWWEVFGSGQLFTFAVRANDRLIALAPLFLHSWKGQRQITFLGNGVSDYLDILCEPEAGTTAWTAILACLADLRHRWDLCDLQDFRAQSVVLNVPVAKPLQGVAQPQCVCTVIPLPGTAQQFHDALPHGLRRNLRRYRSQLRTEGSVEFDTADRGASPDPPHEYVDALITLHQARWNGKDGPGMFGGRDVELFHRKAARNLWRSGLVRLHALRLNGTIAAVVYAFVHRNRAYSYLGGFEPKLARYSPGALIMSYTIHDAIEEGVREFDFLRGNESYKTDWGARPETTRRLLLWHQHRPADMVEDVSASAPHERCP